MWYMLQTQVVDPFSRRAVSDREGVALTAWWNSSGAGAGLSCRVNCSRIVSWSPLGSSLVISGREQVKIMSRKDSGTNNEHNILFKMRHQDCCFHTTATCGIVSAGPLSDPVMSANGDVMSDVYRLHHRESWRRCSARFLQTFSKADFFFLGEEGPGGGADPTLTLCPTLHSMSLLRWLALLFCFVCFFHIPHRSGQCLIIIRAVCELSPLLVASSQFNHQ